MTAVSDAWVCCICSATFVFCVALAAHVTECHDEWLVNRVPPPPQIPFGHQIDENW